MRVIIPFANTDNLKTCLGAIWKQTPHCGVSVVSDGWHDPAHIAQEVRHLQGVSPFCFSRNVNLAIRVTQDDVVVINDDAVLIRGSLEDLMEEAVRIGGIVSSSIRGVVNNPDQLERRGDRVRQLDTGYLAFVCVAIPRSVINHNGMGLLDERYVTYGGEDVDYCHSARVNNIPLAVHDGVVVDHGNLLPSTFRRNGVPDIEPGLRILREKWERIKNTPLPL